MSGWRDVSLGEGIDVLHGFAFKGEYFRDEGDLIVLTPGNFFDGGGFKPKDGREKYYDGPFPRRFLLAAGDVVVAMTEQVQGLLGSSATIPVDHVYLHNQRIGLLRITAPDVLDERFVYHLMNTPCVRSQIQATATGSKVRHTAPERIKAVRVSAPSLPMQRRLASILDSIDDLVKNSRRRVEVLEETARAVYQEWFVHFRYPGHVEAPLVGPPTLIPRGWEVRSLGELAVNHDRRRRPLSKAARAERRGTFPYYGAAKLIDWVDGWIFDGEHLLFAEDGTVQTADGFPVLQLVDEQFWANNHTHILQGHGVSTRFLYLACAAQPIAGYVTGAAQPKITQANLNQMPIVVATPDLQHQFDKVIDPIFDEWRVLRRAADQLVSLRDFLLPKLVTGQIDMSRLDLEALTAAATT